MNKTLVITVIVFVAVIMGFSAVAPMIPQAEGAHDIEVCDKIKKKKARILCERHGPNQGVPP